MMQSDLLRDTPSCIEMDEMKKYAEDNGFCGCFRTSAKENDGINEAIVFLMQRIIDNMKNATQSEPQKDPNAFVISPASNQPPQASTGCCGSSSPASK
jgi:hypothetical protein